MPRKKFQPNAAPRILVVDDKEPMRDVLRKFLASEGYAVETAENGRAALEKFARNSFELVLSDIKMPAMDGAELLTEILKIKPRQIVILMTAFGSIEAAVEAIRRGATDYVSKPFQMEDVLFRIARALNERRLEKRVAELESEIGERTAMRKIIGNSSAINRLKQIIERVAPLDDTVLITGETGTGKELIARALHEAGRARRKFVALDCSSIPETLIEAELFGHEKGTFTGANETRGGLFETVADGTLFLDEVETLSLAVQAKLLRVLQEKVFRRVGGRIDIAFQARVVAATNQDLTALIEEEKFRRDLFYRLNVLPIDVPPLRMRREDIPEIIAYLLRKRARELNATEQFKLSVEALNRLQNHEWRGNVRELENVISYVTALGGETIDASDLPAVFQKNNSIFTVPLDQPNASQKLSDLEKNHILRTLEKFDGSQVKAAESLGIDRRTLYNKLRQYEIE